MDQLKNSLEEELDNATKEVFSELKVSEDRMEHMKTDYFKALGFNPDMFAQTLHDMVEVKKNCKSLLIK